MKKFLALTGMIACILGMTACGSEKEYTAYEQQKLAEAQKVATEVYVPYIQSVVDNPQVTSEYFKDYTSEETEMMVEQAIYMYTYYKNNEPQSLEVDGYAFVSALESFEKAYDEIGGPAEITGSDAVIDGKKIVVTVYVQGTEQEATAEVVVSNDMFYRLESASLNKVSTMSDSMTKAALNTLLGMGSVFVVLVLISLIISCFALIPKIQGAFAKKKEEKETVSTAGIDNAVAQISEQEENVADDLELVAVIAAAIAASEGATSTDGFVVRSIKRRRAY